MEALSAPLSTPTVHLDAPERCLVHERLPTNNSEDSSMQFSIGIGLMHKSSPWTSIVSPHRVQTRWHRRRTRATNVQ